MTLKQLVEIVQERGMRIELGPDGIPMLTGKVKTATPKLMRVLKLRRAEIIDWLKQQKGKRP